MKKQITCQIAQSGIAFIKKSAYACCMTNHEGGGFIKLIDDYENSPIDWDDVFSRKKELLDTMKNGEIPSQCKGCSKIISADGEVSYQFGDFNIAPFVPCNCQCIYCPIWQQPSQKNIRFAPIIQAMYDRNLIMQSEDTTMYISGGEPLLIKDFDDLLYTSARCGIHNFGINTTGIIFSQAIADVMSREDKIINVVISIDSGNPKLYKKIKGVDSFNKVTENIKKYVKVQNPKHSAVKTKYIIIPDVNDTEKDITEWYKLSKKLGIKTVILDVERDWFVRNEWKLPDEYLKLIDKIKDMAKKDGLKVEYYESLQNYMSKIG